MRSFSMISNFHCLPMLHGKFVTSLYCFCYMISLSAGTIIFIVILRIIGKENYKPKVILKKSCQGRWVILNEAQWKNQMKLLHCPERVLMIKISAVRQHNKLRLALKGGTWKIYIRAQIGHNRGGLRWAERKHLPERTSKSFPTPYQIACLLLPVKKVIFLLFWC